MGKNQHVIKVGDKWGVLGEKNAKYTQIFNTQKEAIAKAREIAKNQESEVVIHGKNGQFRDRISFGNDPYPPEG